MLANTSLVQLIKKIAMDAFNASKPCNVMVGKVQSVSPLKISIGQQLLIDDDFLIVGDSVKEHLAANQIVVLIRQSGGQRFLVVDTISNT